MDDGRKMLFLKVLSSLDFCLLKLKVCRACSSGLMLVETWQLHVLRQHNDYSDSSPVLNTLGDLDAFGSLSLHCRQAHSLNAEALDGDI